MALILGLVLFFFPSDFSLLFRYTFKSDVIIVECSQISNALQVCLVLGCNVGSTKKALLSKKKRKALCLLWWMLLSVDRSSVLPVCAWTRSTLDATVIKNKKTKQEIVGNVLISEGEQQLELIWC